MSNRHLYDEKALEIARQFTQDIEGQRRARLQVAVLDAMEYAARLQADGNVEAQAWHAKADRLKKCVDYAPSGDDLYRFRVALSEHLDTALIS